jgi:YihY family inner membrane protein
MSAATRVPETIRMRGDELSAEDAWTTLRRYRTWPLVKDSFVRFRYGDGFTHARALALQLSLAIIPLVIAVVGVAATLHQRNAARVITLTLEHFTPGASKAALRETLQAGQQRGGGGTLALTFGLIAALVSLTTAMGQVERGANRIYGIERDRPSQRKYLRAFLHAVTAGLASLLGFAIVVNGGAISDALAQVYGRSAAPTGWAAVRWPLGILLALVSITMLLKSAPHRRQPGHSWLAVGASVALGLWVGFSLLLALYAATSTTFGSLYGPLTAVLALLIWADLSSIALFLGVAFAAQLEAVRAGVPRPAHADPEPALTGGAGRPPPAHPAAIQPRLVTGR